MTPKQFTDLGVVRGVKVLQGHDGVTGDKVVLQRFHVKVGEAPAGVVHVAGVYSMRVGMEKGMYFPNQTQAEVHFDNITRPMEQQELAYSGEGLLGIVTSVRNKYTN